jgi:hypothetical protein
MIGFLGVPTGTAWRHNREVLKFVDRFTVADKSVCLMAHKVWN